GAASKQLYIESSYDTVVLAHRRRDRVQGGQPSAQLLLLLPGRGHVAQERRDAGDGPAVVVDDRDAKLERHSATALVQRRNSQAAAATSAHAAGHHGVVPGPVTRPQLLRDDEIERLADRIGGGVAEGRFGPRVPEADHSATIRDHDRIRATLDESAVERCA